VGRGLNSLAEALCAHLTGLKGFDEPVPFFCRSVLEPWILFYLFWNMSDDAKKAAVVALKEYRDACEERRFEDSVRILQKFMVKEKKYVHSPKLHLCIAKAYLELNQLEMALKALDEAVKFEKPKTSLVAEISLVRADALLRKYQLVQAQRCIIEAGEALSTVRKLDKNIVGSPLFEETQRILNNLSGNGSYGASSNWNFFVDLALLWCSLKSGSLHDEPAFADVIGGGTDPVKCKNIYAHFRHLLRSELVKDEVNAMPVFFQQLAPMFNAFNFAQLQVALRTLRKQIQRSAFVDSFEEYKGRVGCVALSLLRAGDNTFGQKLGFCEFVAMRLVSSCLLAAVPPCIVRLTAARIKLQHADNNSGEDVGEGMQLLSEMDAVLGDYLSLTRIQECEMCLPLDADVDLCPPWLRIADPESVQEIAVIETLTEKALSRMEESEMDAENELDVETGFKPWTIIPDAVPERCRRVEKISNQHRALSLNGNNEENETLFDDSTADDIVRVMQALDKVAWEKIRIIDFDELNQEASKFSFEKIENLMPELASLDERRPLLAWRILHKSESAIEELAAENGRAARTGNSRRASNPDNRTILDYYTDHTSSWVEISEGIDELHKKLVDTNPEEVEVIKKPRLDDSLQTLGLGESSSILWSFATRREERKSTISTCMDFAYIVFDPKRGRPQSLLWGDGLVVNQKCRKTCKADWEAEEVGYVEFCCECGGLDDPDHSSCRLDLDDQILGVKDLRVEPSKASSGAANNPAFAFNVVGFNVGVQASDSSSNSKRSEQSKKKHKKSANTSTPAPSPIAASVASTTSSSTSISSAGSSGDFPIEDVDESGSPCNVPPVLRHVDVYHQRNESNLRKQAERLLRLASFSDVKLERLLADVLCQEEFIMKEIYRGARADVLEIDLSLSICENAILMGPMLRMLDEMLHERVMAVRETHAETARKMVAAQEREGKTLSDREASEFLAMMKDFQRCVDACEAGTGSNKGSLLEVAFQSPMLAAHFKTFVANGTPPADSDTLTGGAKVLHSLLPKSSSEVTNEDSDEFFSEARIKKISNFRGKISDPLRRGCEDLFVAAMFASAREGNEDVEDTKAWKAEVMKILEKWVQKEVAQTLEWKLDHFERTENPLEMNKSEVQRTSELVRFIRAGETRSGVGSYRSMLLLLLDVAGGVLHTFASNPDDMREKQEKIQRELHCKSNENCQVLDKLRKKLDDLVCKYGKVTKQMLRYSRGDGLELRDLPQILHVAENRKGELIQTRTPKEKFFENAERLLLGCINARFQILHVMIARELVRRLIHMARSMELEASLLEEDGVKLSGDASSKKSQKKKKKQRKSTTKQQQQQHSTSSSLFVNSVSDPSHDLDPKQIAEEVESRNEKDLPEVKEEVVQKEEDSRLSPSLDLVHDFEVFSEAPEAWTTVVSKKKKAKPPEPIARAEEDEKVNGIEGANVEEQTEKSKLKKKKKRRPRGRDSRKQSEKELVEQLSEPRGQGDVEGFVEGASDSPCMSTSSGSPEKVEGKETADFEAGGDDAEAEGEFDEPSKPEEEALQENSETISQQLAEPAPLEWIPMEEVQQPQSYPEPGFAPVTRAIHPPPSVMSEPSTGMMGPPFMGASPPPPMFMYQLQQHQEQQMQAVGVCRYYLTQGCRYGRLCRNRHISPMELQTEMMNLQQQTQYNLGYPMPGGYPVPGGFPGPNGGYPMMMPPQPFPQQYFQGPPEVPNPNTASGPSPMPPTPYKSEQTNE